MDGNMGDGGEPMDSNMGDGGSADGSADAPDGGAPIAESGASPDARNPETAALAQ